MGKREGQGMAPESLAPRSVLSKLAACAANSLGVLWPKLMCGGADRVLRYAHFSRHVLRLASRFQLFQCSDDLSFGMPAHRHACSLSFVRNHTRTCSESGEQVRLAQVKPPDPGQPDRLPLPDASHLLRPLLPLPSRLAFHSRLAFSRRISLSLRGS